MTQEYTLNCDKCKVTYNSLVAFPEPQLCPRCLSANQEKTMTQDLKEKITECGEILVGAYQARVDGLIESDELRCYIEDYPNSILDSIQQSLPGQRRTFNPTLPQNPYERGGEGAINMPLDIRLRMFEAYVVAQQDMIEAGWRKMILPKETDCPL